MCERRKRIERRSCCRFHRFLQHLRQSISKKPSCRAGRRALVERYAFFRFGADPKTAELLFGTQCFGVLFALTFGNAAAVPLPPERKSERSYGEHGKRKSAPAARRGQSFQKTRRSVSAERSANFILLRLRFRTPFPSAEGLVPRKSGGCNPRLVCAVSYKSVWRPHLRFASRRKNRFLGRLPRAGKMLPDFNRRITSVGKAAEPQCRAVAGAAFPLRPARCGVWKPEGLSFVRQRWMLLMCRRIFSPAL